MNRESLVRQYDHAEALRILMAPATSRQFNEAREKYSSARNVRHAHDKALAAYKRANPGSKQRSGREYVPRPTSPDSYTDESLVELRRRTPEGWIVLLKIVEGWSVDLARACACIVFWDYISERSDWNKRPEFIRCASSRHRPVECFDLLAAMMWLGWSLFAASQRIDGNQGIDAWEARKLK